MTLDEFLKELEKLDVEWKILISWRGDRLIRTKHQASPKIPLCDCPITAVYNSMFPDDMRSTSETSFAARKLGLSEMDTDLIVLAADSTDIITENVRSKLLRACKL